MVLSFEMMTFKDFRNFDIYITDEVWQHIIEKHSDVTLKAVERALKQPDLVIREELDDLSEVDYDLYYEVRVSLSKKQRFFKVVVKICPDGNFLATAYIDRRMAEGRLIYQREENG